MKKHAPVLIANRGEIAIRISKTARALGFPVVAIYSDADRFAEHVRYADQAYYVGAAAPKESYLNVERILEVAKRSGARYVHPGYGFLSERPHFVEACEKAGLIFVGPSAESMRLMGDKIQARQTVDSLKVPRVPGSAGVVKTWQEAASFAKQVGYPVLLKAAAGGGGKGMRRVDSEAEISSAFDGATREAVGAFGDGSMYVEKLILEPHHVEIQVFGDGKGKAIHLGERECSIQRRHQKVWEESPAPILNRYPQTRPAMFEAAVRVAEHVRYAGAGTFEFIVDGKGSFYFLEMNTRLQVEHPVTEWVTGVDLVAWQLLLAAGELKLPASPERRGSAIEVRLYAEDPHTFLPAPGPLGLIELPTGSFVRSDSAFGSEGEVTVHYDPMISKISVWAPTREEAVDRLRVALDETRVESPRKIDGTRQGSLRTNLSFLRRLVRNETVRGGDTTTDLIAKNPDLTAAEATEPSLEAALALSIHQLLTEQGPAVNAAPVAAASNWSRASWREGVQK
ncbi:MAG: biotin carboxylase N-terminal domain-containing protein [Oligoflexia bacterium]|nr:biotin carboxylase N-terminal domain-containing protein [Oligoflexia bacterium]